MTAGIKIFNKDRQMMVSNNDICFGLSQKIIATSASKRAYDKPFMGNASVTGCVNPLIVYNLEDEANMVNILNGTSNPSGFDFTFITKNGSITADFYIFDISANAQKQGQPVFRLYTPDGELAFDSRVKGLAVIGEVYDGMLLDPNKQYGVLMRSRSPYIRADNWWESGRKVYWEIINSYQMTWRDGNTLRHSMTRLSYALEWFWRDTFGPAGPSHQDGMVQNKQVATPLLVDLSLIKSLE